MEALQGRNLRIMETVRGRAGAFDVLDDVFGDGSFLILASHGVRRRLCMNLRLTHDFGHTAHPSPHFRFDPRFY